MDKLPFDFSSIPPIWTLCYDSYPQSEIPQRKTRGRYADMQSKLGVCKFSNVYGISGNNVTAGQKDYAARMMQIEKQREEYYKSLGTPPGVPTMKGATADPDNTGRGYNDIIGDLGDHSVPEGWVQHPKRNTTPGTPPGPPIQWGAPEDPDNAQPGYGYIPTDTTNTEDIFFYHSDHLGSTSYITDAKANITQFDAYLPYGELLVDEHSSSEDMPYKFNGKELDEETGLYYYGARYMDPKISMWLGVDPLMEKYPNVTGYCYTMDNPIRFIDPDGRDGMVTGNGTETDPYIITAKYFYKKGTLDESQKQGLNDAINAYNNLGGGSGIKVKDHNRTFYAKYNLSAEEVKDVNEVRLNTCFETTSGEPRYYGNIVGTEVDSGNEYGSANNIRIDFNVENIKKGIGEGIDSRDINASTAIHEIGHNLGAEHSDKTSVMKLLHTIERTSIEGKTLKTYDFPRVDKNSIKVLFNKRDTPKEETSNGRLWTKKVN